MKPINSEKNFTSDLAAKMSIAPIEYRNRNKLVPIKSPLSVQLTRGTLEVWYNGDIVASIKCNGLRGRKTQMDYHTRRMVNLHKEKYFVWKPETKEVSDEY